MLAFSQTLLKDFQALHDYNIAWSVLDGLMTFTLLQGHRCVR